MSKKQSTLTELYAAYIAPRAADLSPFVHKNIRKNVRLVSRLAARGVTTELELFESLPGLPPQLRNFGFHWIMVSRPKGAAPYLLRMLQDHPSLRLECSRSLCWLESRRSDRLFTKIGRSQLASSIPDLRWLQAVVQGLRNADDAEAVDVLVLIYERVDLPGWLRGDAGDALGCKPQLRDRRARVFQRIWMAALRGLSEPDIEVQFWSMYVIMQLAVSYAPRKLTSNRRFEPALPRLREIAAQDERLAPGFWWPMCEEARDAIEVIETGTGPQVDAAERWSGRTERGEMCKRQ